MPAAFPASSRNAALEAVLPGSSRSPMNAPDLLRSPQKSKGGFSLSEDFKATLPPHPNPKQSRGAEIPCTELNGRSHGTRQIPCAGFNDPSWASAGGGHRSQKGANGAHLARWYPRHGRVPMADQGVRAQWTLDPGAARPVWPPRRPMLQHCPKHQRSTACQNGHPTILPGDRTTTSTHATTQIERQTMLDDPPDSRIAATSAQRASVRSNTPSQEQTTRP